MDATTPQTGRSSLKLSWLHPAGLAGLSVVNFLLKVVTLGIYAFWAKTEVRKRIWSAVRFNGEPLTYTGTGKELFVGFLMVFGLVLLPTLAITLGVLLMFGPDSGFSNFFQAVVYLFFAFLWGIAIYRAQRYRLSRTVWRGIRGSLVGSDQSYAWAFFWTGLLIPLTLGWIIPWRAAKLQSMMVNDTWFGDRPFMFSADPKPLYKRFAMAWLAVAAIGSLASVLIGGVVGATILTPELDQGSNQKLLNALVILLTLAMAYLLYSIVSAWYRAHQTNYFAQHTFFEGANFRGTLTARGLIWIAVTNFLIMVASLGLLAPVVMARTARYQVENIAIDGSVPLASISQGADQGLQRGEGLAQAFDFDAF